MNVAFVTAEYPPKNIGGAGISSKLIVDELRRQDVSTDVFVLNGDDRQVNRISSNRYEHPSGGAYPVPEEIGENLSVLHTLSDLAEYDVVHSYNTGHLPAVVARASPPVVATINNHMWVCVDPTQFLKDGCPPSNPRQVYRYAGTAGYSGIRRIGRVGLEYLGRSMAKRADAITVQNEGMKHVLSRCGYAVDTISVIPNLVDPQFFVENDGTEADEKRTLVFLGRLVENKGPVHAANAFVDLPRDIHRNWEFHIYGQGPQASTIERLIDTSPAEVDIELKYSPYPELPAVYRSADALFHASRYTEPFSRTWLEAMASNTPIICSRNPSSEAVLSDVAVLYDLFDEGEPQATLADVLRRDDLQRLARKGRELIERYRPAVVCTEYIDLYEDVI
ncbi:glycosyltransferase family 4 protein [Halorhabdus sp. BNX81]|uniref:glycosyltransferase family 4 protein n=1 Tax=Halorhabdus sp. BNX81 TaxID=2980181 RepID=UPI0023DD0B64|nr:glycosyltransferase family 4 protein [Halorhabdus sp. BNX81]WEL20596.1 Glycosyltransferase [Halorhabdus sp. BNX81]